MAATRVSSQILIVEADGTQRPITLEDYPTDHPYRAPVPAGTTRREMIADFHARNAETVRRMLAAHRA